MQDVLTKEEIAWINGYHARVWAKIGPQLDGGAQRWLERSCAALG